MKLFWATLLLCGLLPISHSTEGTSGSARVKLPTDVWEKRLQEEVAKADPMKDLEGKTLRDIGNQDVLADVLRACTYKGLSGGILGGSPGDGELELLCKLLNAKIENGRTVDVSLKNAKGGLLLRINTTLALDGKGIQGSLQQGERDISESSKQLRELQVNVPELMSAFLILFAMRAGTPVAKLVNCQVEVTTDLRLLNKKPVIRFLNKALKDQFCSITKDVVALLNRILADRTITVNSRAATQEK